MNEEKSLYDDFYFNYLIKEVLPYAIIEDEINANNNDTDCSQ